MSRIACLRIPKFPIVVQQRQEPELRGQPFVLTGGRSRVLLCSAEAAKQYVREGMRLSEARAACAQLICREYDERSYMIAQKEMLGHLVSLSPRVSSYATGIFLMDAEGLSHMGGENTFARNILKFVSQKGFTSASVGIADSAFTATIAAQNQRRRWQIIAAGQDHQFLSVIPISYLPVSLELKETLLGLGIERMGQLTDLAREEVLQRFQKEGLLAYELASGIDRRRPTLPKTEAIYQCYVDIGGPVESFNDTIFVIKSMLERLTVLLSQQGLSAEELTMCFYSDDELFDERSVRLIRPSNKAKFLLEVLKLSIENKRLAREYTSLRLLVSRTAKESYKQMPFFSNEALSIATEEGGDFSESFLLLIQKLNTRFGENVLVQPVAVDQYTPEKAGAWEPAITARNEHPKVSIDYVKQALGSSALVSGLVLKKHQQPPPVLMEFHQGQPRAFTCKGVFYKIQTITNPECLSGMWWECPIRKSYYTTLVQPSNSDRMLLIMLVYDHDCRTWFIEGEYD